MLLYFSGLTASNRPSVKWEIAGIEYNLFDCFYCFMSLLELCSTWGQLIIVGGFELTWA